MRLCSYAISDFPYTTSISNSDNMNKCWLYKGQNNYTRKYNIWINNMQSFKVKLLFFICLTINLRCEGNMYKI